MATERDLQPMKIVSERHFANPPKALFAAFADPDRLRKWWGPAGFSNTIHDFDFRPGGIWNYTMHAPDGNSFANNCTFEEIIADRKIAFVHHLPMHVFTMTMTLERNVSGTLLTWHMDFEPNETNAAVRPFVEAGNEQNFDRLEHHLKTHGASHE